MTVESAVTSRVGSGRGQVARWLAVAVILAVVLPVAWWVRETGVYFDTTRRTTLTWQCTNGIFLPFTTGARHYRWWAGASPVPQGIGAFVATTGPGLAYRTSSASGKVRFDSLTHATFTSDLGQRMTFTRESPGTFHDTGCGISPLGAAHP